MLNESGKLSIGRICFIEHMQNYQRNNLQSFKQTYI